MLFSPEYSMLTREEKGGVFIGTERATNSQEGDLAMYHI